MLTYRRLCDELQEDHEEMYAPTKILGASIVAKPWIGDSIIDMEAENHQGVIPSYRSRSYIFEIGD